jgi:hypothetical protein
MGHGHGHAHGAPVLGHAMPLPVSGGSHDHVPSSGSAAEATGHNVGREATVPDLHGEHQPEASIWPDLTKKEALTLFPLAVLTIVTGIFPGPIFELVEPAFERILALYR